MATVNLLPDSTASNNWTVSSGGTAHENLADTTDSTNIETNVNGRVCIMLLDNFTEDFDSIDSVRYYVSSFLYRSRTGDSDLQIKIENVSGTALYTETENIVPNGGAFADYYGTARAEYSTGVPWTNIHLNGMRIQLNTNLEDPPAISYVRITKAHVEVTYTPAVSADNATFFGTNF